MIGLLKTRPTVFAGLPRRLKSSLTMALALLVVAIAVSRHLGRGEFNFNVDESQHATTGQFVASLIRDHPFQHPVEYTYLYYAHYPALSGVLHWPPFFYLSEGLAFLVFGASVVTARIAILAFAMLGLAFWFRLIERLHSIQVALAATLLLGLVPVVALFEKLVMLEIPSLTLAIVASYFWIRFLLDQRNAFLYWFSFSAAVAMLTKQNDIYLPFFCLLSLAALNGWRLLYRRSALTALAIGVITAGPYYLLLYRMHWSTIAGDVLEKQPSIFGTLTFYLAALPELTGWPVLIMALAGLATCFLWATRTNALIFGSWFVAVYGTMTMIGHKEARYVVCLIPPVVYFALWPILWKAVPRWVAATVPGILIAYLGWSAWQMDRPYVSGYTPVAREIRQISNSGIILVDTEIPANFIFFMRNEDPEGRFVVLRKALYSCRIKESLGCEVYLSSPNDLESIFRVDGIRFIVVSNRPPENFPINFALRSYLQSSQFRLLGSFPVEGNSPEWKNYTLMLYENLQAHPPESLTLHIPMETLSSDIEVPFDELGIFPPVPLQSRMKR
jgi:hypothetical protein